MARKKATNYYQDFLRDLRTSTTFTSKQLNEMQAHIIEAIEKAKKRLEETEKERALKSIEGLSEIQKQAIYDELKKSLG